MSSLDKNLILEKLLEDRKVYNEKLPTLTENIYFGKFFEDIIKSAVEVLNKIFSGKNYNISADFLQAIISFGISCIYILLGILFIYLAYVLIKFLYCFYKRANLFDQEENNILKPQLDREDSYAQIDILIREKRFKEALRLRWQIFINFSKIKKSTTPAEFLSNQSYLDHFSISSDLIAKIREAYLYMFDEKDLTESSISNYIGYISKLDESLMKKEEVLN